ncbi:hypothetical protein CTAYLR_002878 [Chrysophaeum taylorii]|uniref:Uncharacterized protein n=1 Tax=Chrysophaeum taylorii TaxID=2483200 RepID=A0AAD7UA39_9STRA|nr:hypothetical protein CTAYLR_002878 [Chrysophaeum taylorii]
MADDNNNNNDEDPQPEEEKQPQRRSSRSDSQQQQDVMNPHVLNEFVSDKLNLINYYEEFCKPRDMVRLSKWYFAMATTNPSLQFQTFVELCGWLMEKITGDKTFFRLDKFDDPNTSVNKLLLALRKLDMGVDFASSKLKQAYGEAACTVLDSLTERAVKKCFVWKPPEYPVEEEEEAEVDEDADAGDVEDEVEPAVDDEEILFREPGIEEEEDPEYKESRDVLKSGVDPVAWQLEVERVGSKLRIANQRSTAANEWRAHIDQTKDHEAKIREILPTTEKKLAFLGDKMTEAREKITLKENYINNQFDQKKETYKTLRDEFVQTETKFKEATDNVAKRTNDLAAIATQLDDIKATMNDRGNSMTDTSPLVQIKQALKSLKKEVVDFDLQIGVVGHTLMQQKLRHGNPAGTSKGYKMRGKNPAPNNPREHDDDSTDGDTL